MRVSKFIMDAERCSGRIQRMILEEIGLTERQAREGGEIASVMDRLQLVDTIAVVTHHAGDHEFDIERVGVRPDKTLVLELRRRWTALRILNLAVVGILVIGGVVIAFVIGQQLGFDAGLGFQLDTL